MPKHRHTLSAVINAEAELNATVYRYLVKNGWKNTSQTPGSHWLWTREWEGHKIMVTQSMALDMQRTYFAKDPHDWVDSEGLDVCSQCGVGVDDESIPEECVPRVDA